MNGLGAVSLSVAAKKHPQGDLLPAPVPSSQLGVPKLQAPKVTPSPRQASPTQHPAENLWVPGPASASNIMLGTAGEDDQSPPATPKPLQQVQSPSAALPLSPLNRDPPASTLQSVLVGIFTSASILDTSHDHKPSPTPNNTRSPSQPSCHTHSASSTFDSKSFAPKRSRQSSQSGASCSSFQSLLQC